LALSAAEWGEPPWRSALISPKYDGIVDARGGRVVVFAHHQDPVVDVVNFLVANDPATVIRHCERDLKVLERHQRRVDPSAWWLTYCTTCAGSTPRWPCHEILDLADAYAVSTSSKGEVSNG
jgi:hypothetical protein